MNVDDKIDAKVDRMLDRLLERQRPNAKSLIVSVFGDAILPHGGNIWLGSLADLVAPFGCNERVVRTCVFRLSKEGWLASTQVGRRSFYSLTESGRRRFAAAHKAIYAFGGKPWSGRWTIVFSGLAEGPPREALRDDLAWQGFGQLMPGVMLHPEPDEASLRQALVGDGLDRRALTARARAEDWAPPDDMRDVVARAWDIDGIGAIYAAFLDDFRPFLELVGAGALSPRAAFRLRILLIHAWRRAVLRDPLLPEELLPTEWLGAASRLVCRNIYRAVQGAAEIYLATTMDTAYGPIAEPSPSYFERFGGLVDLTA